MMSSKDTRIIAIIQSIDIILDEKENDYAIYIKLRDIEGSKFSLITNNVINLSIREFESKINYLILGIKEKTHTFKILDDKLYKINSVLTLYKLCVEEFKKTKDVSWLENGCIRRVSISNILK